MTPIAEQETTIGFTRDSDECFVYTSDTTMMTKLDKLVEKSDKWTLDETMRSADTGEIVGKTYKTIKKLISFRADVQKSNISDEQREAMRERMRELGKQNRKNQK